MTTDSFDCLARFRRLALRMLPVLLAGLAACGTGDTPEAASHGPVLEPVTALDLGDGHDIHALSGLWVSPDGERMVAISDRGHRFVGALSRNDDGRIVGVDSVDFGALGDVGHKHDRWSRDAEALAVEGDGDWIVAFERDHRLARYDGPEIDGLKGVAERLEMPAAVRWLPNNSGIEALARLSDDALLAIAEAKSGPDFSHPAWIGRPGAWTTFHVTASPGWAPVDAATLPGGDVLVLERWYMPVLGFRSRLSVLPAAVIDGVARAGQVYGPVETVALGPIDPEIGRDNYEGLAVRALADGAIEVLIVSDDNEPSEDQRPLLLQYRLDPEALAARIALQGDA